MPDASAAEAAERKRVMEAVAKMLEAAVLVHEHIDYQPEYAAWWLARVVKQAAVELRTPVGREANQ